MRIKDGNRFGSFFEDRIAKLHNGIDHAGFVVSFGNQ